MFGNALGWLISAVLAAMAGYAGYQLAVEAQPTPPSGWVQKSVKPLALDDAVKAVLDPMTNIKDDAGALYRQATEDFDRHTDGYKELTETRDFDEAQINALKGFDFVITAAQCPTMDLFASKPDEIVGYNTDVPVLTKLDAIAKAMETVILNARGENQLGVAHKFSNALAAMGYHLYKERVAYIELSAGEDYLGAGGDELLKVTKDEHAAAKLPALQQLQDKRLTEFKECVLPVENVISAIGDQDIAQYTGDMFQLAADDKTDRVWRVEAIRKLGRLRKNATKEADQLKADKVLKRMASEVKDPIIRAAATHARDMTSAENQSQR